MPSGSVAWLIAGALLFTQLAACSRSAPQPAPSPPARPAIKVPLPEAWTARSAGDQALVIGPAGREVLRIDVHPAAAAELPSPGTLSSRFANDVRDFELDIMEQHTEEGLALVLLGLRPLAGGDGKEEISTQLLLGAKRVGQDLFLCATMPGASEGEVREAMQACRGLGVSGVVSPVRPTTEPH